MLVGHLVDEDPQVVVDLAELGVHLAARQVLGRRGEARRSLVEGVEQRIE